MTDKEGKRNKHDLLLPAQEAEVTIPSVQVNLRCCRNFLKPARAMVLCTATQNKQIVNKRSLSCY